MAVYLTNLITALGYFFIVPIIFRSWYPVSEVAFVMIPVRNDEA